MMDDMGNYYYYMSSTHDQNVPSPTILAEDFMVYIQCILKAKRKVASIKRISPVAQN